jgi:hypothetical protein
VQTAINSSGIPFLFAVVVKPKRTAGYFLSAFVLREESKFMSAGGLVSGFWQ